MAFYGLEVHLATSEREEGHFSGRCLGIETIREGIVASVEFELARAPLLQVGQTTDLEFREEGLEPSVCTSALTILRTDDSAHRCYCFQGQLSKRVLMHLMNRRRTPRTRLAPSEGLTVSILDLGEPPPEALLHDISATGLSILVEPEHERLLFYRSDVRLLFRQPGVATSIEVQAVIRHRRLAGARVLYGLEIEGQIPDFMRAQERFLLHLASLRDRALEQG